MGAPTTNFPPEQSGLATSAIVRLPEDVRGTAQQAADLFIQQRYDEAAAKYQSIIDEYPDSLYAWSNLGVVRFQQGELGDAQTSLERAVNLSPKDAFSYQNLGIVYYETKKYDEAISALERALALDPTNAKSHNYLGCTCSRKGWSKVAEKEFLKAIAIDDTFGDAYFNLAVVYALRVPPDFVMAGRYYDRALKLGVTKDPELEKKLPISIMEKGSSVSTVTSADNPPPPDQKGPQAKNRPALDAVSAPFSNSLSPEPVAPGSLASKLVVKGAALYSKLKTNFPDAPIPADADLAPKTIDISLEGPIGGLPVLGLFLPETVWSKLSDGQRDSLVALLRSKIREARENPENYALTKPEAPVHPAEIANIRTIKDNAWEVDVGHQDADGYLIIDNAALKGADYQPSGITSTPIFLYANSKDDPVYNSSLDGSVLQVREYHKKSLNDPASVSYANWTKVIKTGEGYQVSVTFRAKNEIGAYMLRDQTFDLDKQGLVTKVTNNDE